MNNRIYIAAATGTALIVLLLAVFLDRQIGAADAPHYETALVEGVVAELPQEPQLDTEEYDRRMYALANNPEPDPVLDPETGEPLDPQPEREKTLWPADAPYPNLGAILPYHRIVAYYGNFYSRGMGILGEFDEETVLAKMRTEIDAWEAADPTTPVMPAIDYIAVVAQAGPGRDGMYRLRMPDEHIDRAIAMAEKIDGIVFLEVQPGLANINAEIRALERYWEHPKVHLAIDPEFAMERTGSRPGIRVGTVDAREVNEAIDYLAEIVRDKELPPKLVMVHRYTQAMVTNATDIAPQPEVQVIMDMDGWGYPQNKFGTYNAYIAPYPVQFTGFKLFYKNDKRWEGSRLLTPAELLELSPKPSFIQYQ